MIFGLSGFLDERGLMIDFGEIKEIWKNEIEIYLDHRYLNETLPPMNTTAENIVVWIYEKMADALRQEERQMKYKGARVEFVRLYETLPPMPKQDGSGWKLTKIPSYGNFRPDDSRRRDGHRPKNDVCQNGRL